MIYKNIVLVVFLIIVGSVTYCQSNSDSFIRGVDISSAPQIENLGGKYKVNGVGKDVLDIFKDNGVNYIRLRLWHTPVGGYCGLDSTLKFAKRIKEKGFKLLLDFHYSDWWADPGKQNKPAVWQNLPFESLKDSVYSYSRNVITTLKNQNSLPDMVQIGNEITGGMLWPDGKLYGVPDQAAQWVKFTELIKEGINGVKDAAAPELIKIMIHIDRGGDNNGAVYFYDHLIAQNVEFDILGLSYYPWWHGTLSQLTYNLNDLAQRYKKEIIIAETAYPWTLQYQNDGVGNIVGSNTTLLQGYPASVKGQKDYLFYLYKLLRDTQGGKGIGFFYWEPAYISVPPIGSPWENVATFNFDGEALESLKAFQNIDSLKSVSVKLRVNTSTNGDTITSKDFVQIRGEVSGTSSSLLPDGKIVSWDENSQLICKNIGGDYWECEFKTYPGDQLQYKIWTGRNKRTPTYLRLGWEGPILPFDSSNLNARLFTALLDDTINYIEYYNTSGDSKDQYWSPFKSYQDSIGILFRVNIGDMTAKGLFDPEKNTIAVRGDSAASSGILSWTQDKILKKEEISINNGSFWSDVIYFPKNKIVYGARIKYKFFIVNSTFGGWESGINDRTFSFPAADSTLVWKYFNDKKEFTDVKNENNATADDFRLFQNYPNPFNPFTKIEYTITKEAKVLLQVFNSLGQTVKVLESEVKYPGKYSTRWNGANESGNGVDSGVYFIQLIAGGKSQVIKIILLR
jgi:arabinogalactan endo-1,4-beta-galactosidase